MRSWYGDKQGKKFRVWVDRVLPTQISSNAWLVKFHKWELSGSNFFSPFTFFFFFFYLLGKLRFLILKLYVRVQFHPFTIDCVNCLQIPFNWSDFYKIGFQIKRFNL